MKAIVFTEYGSPDVLTLQDVEKPVPEANEVLIKVTTSTVNFGDTFVRNFKTVTPRSFTMPGILWLPTRLTLGIRTPGKRTPGSEFVGEVVSIGQDVTRYKIGDRVFGYRGMSMGANAEYLTMPEDGMLCLKPDNMSDTEAVTVPYGMITAVPLIQRLDIQPGQKVLINGASGNIGSYALQLAKYYGAEVTGVCGTKRVGMVKALGADHVIDYTQEDFTQNGETYDIIFDVMRKTTFAHCKNSLTANGRYFLVSFKMAQLFQMLWTSLRGGKRVICGLSPEKLESLQLAKELVEAGDIKTVVDKCFPLAETAAAHRYLESGDRNGHIVITVTEPR